MTLVVDDTYWSMLTLHDSTRATMHLPIPTLLRHSLRRLSRRPLLSLTALFALAVGIAMAAAGFAGLEVALFSELPFDHGDRFVRFQVLDKQGYRGLDVDLYRTLRAESGPGAGAGAGEAPIFEHVGAFSGDLVNLRYESGEVEPLKGNWLTPSSFSHLPYAPVLGRVLAPEDGIPGAEPVVVLRESLWRRRFDAEPSVLGRPLEVAGVARTIVGVLPDIARFPADGEIWLPLDENDPTSGGSVEGALGLGILHPDAELGEARPRFDVAIQQIESERRGLDGATGSHGDEPFDLRASLMPLTEPPPGATPMMSLFVAGLVALLLVVAANLANLVLAQTSARAGELAVRSALGASRRRLVGEIFFDILLLGVVAATLGVSGAHRALAFLDQAIDEKPFWAEFSIGLPTLVFVAACTILACGVAGALPALRATRSAADGGLRGDAGHSFGFRAGGLLTVVQLALSVGLISSALVLANGLSHHGELMLAFPHDDLLTAYVVTPVDADGSPTVTADSIVRESERVAGVRSAATARQVPGLDAPLQSVAIQWREGAEPEPLRLPVAQVREGFFETLGASAVAGRTLRASDFQPVDRGARTELAAVVNEPFVARHLGPREPIGLRLRWSATGRAEDEGLLRVVGVVPDLGLSASNPETAAGLYVPMPDVRRTFYLMLRTDGEPARREQPLRRALLDLDPAIQLRHVQPLARVGWDERAFFSGLGTGLLAMGSMAMLLSLVGLYATASLTVSRRRREIGVRVALGASARQVLALVLSRAAGYVIAGGALGTGLAFLLLAAQGKMFVTRLPVEDPGIVPLVAAALGVAALVACWRPARSALGVSPAEALQSD